MTKIVMKEVKENDRYESQDGWVMQREDGIGPHGYPLNGQWVLRNPEGTLIDFDKYRNDLASHYQINFVHINEKANNTDGKR